MKKVVLIFLLIVSCKREKSDDAKIKERENFFEKSMEQSTYIYQDTLKTGKGNDAIIAVKYYYDTANGVKRIEKRSSGAGYNFFQQVDFLNGHPFKDKTEMIPDGTKAETKQITSLYYVLDGKFISKSSPALFEEKTEVFRLHLVDL